MRAAEPLPPADAAIEAIREGLLRYFFKEGGADRRHIRELRRRIADRIEADVALLDALDGDPDDEPSLGAPEIIGHGRVFDWCAGSTDDLEEENEHGGDIQDEPHDPEEDKGAEEDEGLFAVAGFDGRNYAGRQFR